MNCKSGPSNHVLVGWKSHGKILIVSTAQGDMAFTKDDVASGQVSIATRSEIVSVAKNDNITLFVTAKTARRIQNALRIDSAS